MQEPLIAQLRESLRLFEELPQALDEPNAALKVQSILTRILGSPISDFGKSTFVTGLFYIGQVISDIARMQEALLNVVVLEKVPKNVSRIKYT